MLHLILKHQSKLQVPIKISVLDTWSSYVIADLLTRSISAIFSHLSGMCVCTSELKWHCFFHQSVYKNCLHFEFSGSSPEDDASKVPASFTFMVPKKEISMVPDMGKWKRSQVGYNLLLCSDDLKYFFAFFCLLMTFHVNKNCTGYTLYQLSHQGKPSSRIYQQQYYTSQIPPALAQSGMI